MFTGDADLNLKRGFCQAGKFLNRYYKEKG